MSSIRHRSHIDTVSCIGTKTASSKETNNHNALQPKSIFCIVDRRNENKLTCLFKREWWVLCFRLVWSFFFFWKIIRNAFQCWVALFLFHHLPLFALERCTRKMSTMKLKTLRLRQCAPKLRHSEPSDSRVDIRRNHHAPETVQKRVTSTKRTKNTRWNEADEQGRDAEN